MAEHEWHVVDEVWEAYAQGRLDPADEASVDAHAARCASCREGARAQVSATEMEMLWRGVRLQVTRPEPSRSLRWLRRAGVSEEDVVLLDSAAGFALPWALAVGGAVTTAFLAAVYPAWGVETFLLLAPLVPVLAVVGAFDATDSLRDLATTTPYSKLRLSMLRATAALAVAIPTTLVVGLVVPGLEALAAGWLLPAVATTATTLLLFTWWRVWVACGLVFAGWATFVLSTVALRDVTVIVGPSGDLSFALMALLAVGLLVQRTASRVPFGGGS